MVHHNFHFNWNNMFWSIKAQFWFNTPLPNISNSETRLYYPRMISESWRLSTGRSWIWLKMKTLSSIRRIWTRKIPLIISITMSQEASREAAINWTISIVEGDTWVEPDLLLKVVYELSRNTLPRKKIQIARKRHKREEEVGPRDQKIKRSMSLKCNLSLT